jgi:hypothetical protein
VNDELSELERGLEACERVLNAEGRLAVVSFHSLEDRIVKQFLAERSGRVGRGSRHLPETKTRARTQLPRSRQVSTDAVRRRGSRQSARPLRAASRCRTHCSIRLVILRLVIGRVRMVRLLNFAFIAITSLVCLGVYRVAEEARVAQADLGRDPHGDRATKAMRSRCSARNGRG